MEIDVRQANVEQYTRDDQGRTAVRLELTKGDNPIEDTVNVLQLAKDAFTRDDDGNIAVRVVGIDQEPTIETVHLVTSVLSRDVIIDVEGETVSANKHTYVGIDTHVTKDASIPERILEFITTQWTDSVPADNTSTLTLDHNLNSSTVSVTFTETGYNGELDVPWQYSGLNRIILCVPNSFAFTGTAKIIG